MTIHHITDAQRIALDTFVPHAQQWLSFFDVLVPTEHELAMNATVRSIITYAVNSRETNIVYDYLYHLYTLESIIIIKLLITAYAPIYETLIDSNRNKKRISVMERVEWIAKHEHVRILIAEQHLTSLLENPAAIDKQRKALGVPTVADSKANPSVGINDFFTAGITKQ